MELLSTGGQNTVLKNSSFVCGICLFVTFIIIIIIIIMYPLTARIVGTPQMVSQPVSSIFSCTPLPSWFWWTPGLSIPWCCLLTSSVTICLVFFPLWLCLAKWFWPDLMNGRHDHTTAVCVTLRSSGGLRAVQLPAASSANCFFRLLNCCFFCNQTLFDGTSS